MPKERKALVVLYSPGETSASLDELNTLLNDDWRLMSTTSMGAAGAAAEASQFAALVVLEREENKTVGGFTAG